MNAFVDREPGLLKDYIFLTAKCVQWANWRCKKCISKKERAGGVDGACHIELPGGAPPTREKRDDRILIAFYNDEVQRISAARGI
jgi:hypothetical protein